MRRFQALVVLCVLILLGLPALAQAQGYASVSDGVTLSSDPVVLGRNFNISFTLREVRGGSKTFENVAIAILRADNTHVYDFAMYSNVTISAYGTWSQTATNYFYTTQPPGTYKAVIRGKYQGQWFDFDTTGGGVNPRVFSAVAPAADDHGNSCGAATSIGLNTSVNGSIGSPGDYDYFRVQVPASGTLTAYSTGSTDTWGYLKNSGCSDIASNDDYNGSPNFRVSSPVTAGTYYVAVKHYNSNGTGSYTLRVDFGSNNVITNPLQVPYLDQLDIPQIGEAACASASTAMVLAYHRKIGQSQQDMVAAAVSVFAATSTTQQGLLSRDRLAQHLRDVWRFSSVRFDASYWDVLYQTIRSEIQAGRPLILGSRSMTSAGHYLVVTGYEGDDYRTARLIVNDPYGQWLGFNRYSTSISGQGLRYDFTDITKLSTDGVFVIVP